MEICVGAVVEAVNRLKSSKKKNLDVVPVSAPTDPPIKTGDGTRLCEEFLPRSLLPPGIPWKRLLKLLLIDIS